MNYFKSLNKEDRIKTLKGVNSKLDRAIYYKTLFRFNIFQKRFPNEYEGTGIGDLTGDAKRLEDKLFEDSLKWIGPIQNKLIAIISKKVYIKKYHSSNHSTLRRFLKYEDKI